MPVFLGDYLRDTGDLSAEEHGAYLLLLMRLWAARGHLSSDPSRLARLACVDPSRWDAVWSVIGRFFDVFEGRLSQKRLLAELQRAQSMRAAATDRAKAGADARWGRRNTPQDASSIAQALPEQSSSNATSNAQAVLEQCSPPSPRSPDPDPTPPEPDARVRAIHGDGATARAGEQSTPKLTGYSLQATFARIRADVLGGLPWTMPPTAQGKSSTFAAGLQPEAIPDIERTMRLACEHVRDGRTEWQDGRFKDPGFLFATWMARFTALREEAHGVRQRGKGPGPPLKKTTCEWHAYTGLSRVNKRAPKHDPDCSECRHVAARNSDRRDEPTAIGDVKRG